MDLPKRKSIRYKDFDDCFDYIEGNPYILEARILEKRKKK